MCCEPEEALENLARIATVYRQAAAEGITPAELAQAKSKINSRVVLGSEKPRGRLFSVGGNWLQRSEYRTVQEELAAVAAVTRDDLADLLARYPLERCTSVLIGPLAQ
jgi:predicted Zn-dependent peptidase